MPPKGRRESVATIVLRKTPPHCSSETRRCCSAGVACPRGGGEAEGGVIGDFDGFVQVLHAEEHGDGAEEFFAIDGRGARHASEDGGFEVVAVAQHTLAAGEDACADAGGCLDLSLEMLDCADRCEWADICALLHWIADTYGLHARDKA